MGSEHHGRPCRQFLMTAMEQFQPVHSRKPNADHQKIDDASKVVWRQFHPDNEHGHKDG